MLLAGLASLAFFPASPPAVYGLIGSPAPYFRVQSGDDKELTLDMIKGKVAVIFYQNKDIVDANKRLKDELNMLYYEQDGNCKGPFSQTSHNRLLGRNSGSSGAYGKEESRNTPRKRASPYTATGKVRYPPTIR
jgi:hypothetical protein